MKNLRVLREHYASKSNGRAWVPKRAFKSEQEAIEANFYPNQYRIYPCGVCGAYHVADLKKVKRRKR